MLKTWYGAASAALLAISVFGSSAWGGRVKVSPTLDPNFDSDTYLVLDEFEKFRVYREVDEAEADRNKVIEDISNGQYNRPVRVVSFNTAERRSRDVTTDIAQEMVGRALRAGGQLSRSAHEFVERLLDDVPGK